MATNMPVNIAVIRPVLESDLAQMLEIEKSVNYSPWSGKNFSPCFGGRYKTWVALVDEVICAYIVVSSAADESEILNIAVAANAQTKGLGSKLLAYAIEQVKVCSDNFFLEVRESNTAAIALYEKFGFCELGRRNNYYPAKRGREDALIYALPLL